MGSFSRVVVLSEITLFALTLAYQDEFQAREIIPFEVAKLLRTTGRVHAGMEYMQVWSICRYGVHAGMEYMQVWSTCRYGVHTNNHTCQMLTLESQTKAK